MGGQWVGGQWVGGGSAVRGAGGGEEGSKPSQLRRAKPKKRVKTGVALLWSPMA